MLSKKLIGGLPAVCDWQLTVWEGGRRERPRPVRPLPLPLSPAKLSATDDKLSILLLWGTGDRGQGTGDRGQGTGDREGAGLHMGQDKLPPSGPCTCTHGTWTPNTNISTHPHLLSCSNTTLKPTPRVHTENTLYTLYTTYPLPKFTVKNPTLTYLSMLLFPVPPITKQAGNLTWRLATCKIPSKASHKSTNVQEVACKFHTYDIDHYSTILENSYNDFVLSRWLQSSVVYSSTFFNLNTISMTLSKSTRTQLLRVDTERVS